MSRISRSAILFCLLGFQIACREPASVTTIEAPPVEPPVIENVPPEVPKIIARNFAYPIGDSGGKLTGTNDDKDDWYNVLDFGEENHLGEDWNKNSGGDTDCGEKVFAIAAGTIVYAQHSRTWGNVVIIEHNLPDGKRVQSLYGHLRKTFKKSGQVKLRELIGEIGDADGRYLCHLHFEIRTPDSLMWNKPGKGYSPKKTGWIDPSEFIDKNR